MYNSVIKLISESKTVDQYGDAQITKTERPVFADLRNVGQKEFYEAYAVGLKPEIKFVLADYLDYQNEQKLSYKAFNEATEAEYNIIRTYRSENTLELICSRGVD